MVLAGADHANQSVCCVFQQIADDSTGTAVDDAWPDDHRPHAVTARVEDDLLVLRTPLDERNRVQRSVLGGPVRFAQHPGARRVDNTGRKASGRTAAGRSDERVDGLTIDLLRALRAFERRVND